MYDIFWNLKFITSCSPCFKTSPRLSQLSTLCYRLSHSVVFLTSARLYNSPLLYNSPSCIQLPSTCIQVLLLVPLLVSPPPPCCTTFCTSCTILCAFPLLINFSLPLVQLLVQLYACRPTCNTSFAFLYNFVLYSLYSRVQAANITTTSQRLHLSVLLRAVSGATKAHQ